MKYPEMRQELIGYLLGLSDLRYQRECWVRGECPSGIEHDEFDYAVHFFFDDTELSVNAKSLIGFLLADENEAVLIQALCQRIEAIFDKYGTDLSDEEYINCPEWDAVIFAAKKACAVISGRSGSV